MSYLRGCAPGRPTRSAHVNEALGLDGSFLPGPIGLVDQCADRAALGRRHVRAR